MPATEDVTVRIDADTAPFADALKDLQGLSKSFGSELTNALRGAAVSGKSLERVLRQVGLSLAGMALSQGLKPLQSLTSSLFSGLFGGLGSALHFADGGVPGRVTPFASGGVVSTPTYFPMGKGLGLAGEAGSEAILPLRRRQTRRCCGRWWCTRQCRLQRHRPGRRLFPKVGGPDHRHAGASGLARRQAPLRPIHERYDQLP